MSDPIPIAPDGRCTCRCGDPCPLGRLGMDYRCTREELEACGAAVELQVEPMVGPLDHHYCTADKLKTALDRGGDQARIAAACLDFADTILRKNADYGSSVWKVPVLCPGLNPGDAIKVRMSDKIERLASLANKPPEVVGESYDDTLFDLAAYAVLYLCRPKDYLNDG